MFREEESSRLQPDPVQQQDSQGETMTVSLKIFIKISLVKIGKRSF
jgi:hypothetical protein